MFCMPPITGAASFTVSAAHRSHGSPVILVAAADIAEQRHMLRGEWPM